MDIIPLFKRSIGLTNKVAKVRAPWDPDTGIMALTRATNIRHDSTGRPFRRDGQTPIYLGPYHSVFCDGGEACVIIGGELFIINMDFTLTKIRTGLTDIPMFYKQTTRGIFYSNGMENGVIKDSKSYPWPEDKYDGPETDEQFTGAPVGVHLEQHGAYMLIAHGRYVFYSEPWKFGLFNLSKYIPLKNPVTMVKSVGTGLFISDQSDVYFFKGKVMEELELKRVETSPAFYGSAVTRLVKGTKLGIEEPDLCAVWGSQEGYIAGTPNGATINLSEDVYDPPKVGTRGASLINLDGEIIQCIY